MEKGRTGQTPYGEVTYLDLRHLGEKLIDTKLPFVRELCLKYERIDPVRELIPVRPVVHYMMGGVSTDIDGATPMAGLYAAGETACVSINGANRLGSNSLPECLVFGARAGRAAAEHAAGATGPPPAVEAQAIDEIRRLEHDLLGRGPGTESVAAIREEMQTTMEGAAGIFRTGPEMEKGAETLTELQERVGKVGVADTSRSFNTELLAALELANMLDLSECILAAGTQREESRGAHQRTDFPARDDERFLTHLLVHRNPDGTSRIERLPVTITRWPPGERVYGR
jgi:fumarate reductase flavoprotein subunit